MFACLWVGGAISVNLMLFYLANQDNAHLYGINQAINFVDIWIIIPGNLGLILTGTLYSAFTNWGWFKHKWVTVKWLITLYGFVIGTFWLGPWTVSLEEIAQAQGRQALSKAAYQNNLELLFWWGGFQVLTLIFAVFISSLKPWKRKKLKTT